MFWRTSVFVLFTVTWKNKFGKKIELTREHFRANIFYNFRCGLSRQECIDELKSLFGDEAPFHSTVKNWFNEFNCERRSSKDGPWTSSKNSSCVIDAVRKLIMHDRHVTYREIGPSLGISSISIHSILHKQLAVETFVLVGSRTIWQSLKKVSFRLVQWNVGKIQ